jgi:hypothetical protein
MKVTPQELADKHNQVIQSLDTLGQHLVPPAKVCEKDIEMYVTIFDNIIDRCDWHTARLTGKAKEYIKNGKKS